MHYNEADTRAKLIDPALRLRGWNDELTSREQTLAEIIIINGKAKRIGKGRTDYTLRIKPTKDAHPFTIAVLEAKASHLPPDAGLEQAKGYATAKLLNVPFVFASNGHLFVEFDVITGITSAPRPLSDFPTPDELTARYEQIKGFKASDAAARPLQIAYHGGDSARRYYQDAAIRAVFEKIAAGNKRALLSLATGAGKTRIAVLMAKRLYDASQLKKCLFICDRDELRGQAHGDFSRIFGADAQKVENGDPKHNARVVIATYHSLDVDTEDDNANFLTTHYPIDYFSHIIIDECHRSAWGKWSQVLLRNPNAVQIGLTATPRTLDVKPDSDEAKKDDQITADNYRHFGNPVYEYEMGQGMEDGYLARCEIIRRNAFFEKKFVEEGASGLTRSDLAGKSIRDAITGVSKTLEDTKLKYSAGSFEQRLILPERVAAMCTDLFSQWEHSREGVEQKTIIFCASDLHADRVATQMNNLYTAYCARTGKSPCDYYAFKCTTKGGSNLLTDLRGSSVSHFVATTVDLLSTGVDVPALQNVVFFKYVNSAISFYQMVGRGTRLNIPTNKLMFCLYDYTNATRLFGQAFLTKLTKTKSETEPTDTGDPVPDIPAPESPLEVTGLHVTVRDGGRFVTMLQNGKAMPMPMEDYRQLIAEKLLALAPTLDQFRALWITPEQRRSLLSTLEEQKASPAILREVEEREAYDLYDILTEAAYGTKGQTRTERVSAFDSKNASWLGGHSVGANTVLRAFLREFVAHGTDGLENASIWQLSEVKKAGGARVLQGLAGDKPYLQEIKERIFTV
jgi:type I restriction enzyme R subunit